MKKLNLVLNIILACCLIANFVLIYKNIHTSRVVMRELEVVTHKAIIVDSLEKAADSLILTAKKRPLNLVNVVDDEMPGLTDRSHPDTCIAWMDSNNIVNLQYAK